MPPAYGRPNLEYCERLIMTLIDFGDLLAPEVQHKLVSPHRTRPAGRVQDPVRVPSVELRVRADHLRLHPDPKLQPEFVHLMMFSFNE